MTSTYRQINFIDLLRSALCACASLLVATLAGLLTHWRPVCYFAAILGAGAVCVACPLLPVGLAIVAGYAWATMPRKAAHT